MTRLEPLTPERARGKGRELLGNLIARHGDVGTMVRAMAHSPAVLAGYLDLSRAMKRAKLDRGHSERISLAVQQALGCQTCLQAHLEAAEAIGLPAAEIALARQGTSSDPAVAALVSFGMQVLRAPATITDEQVAALRGYGYSDRRSRTSSRSIC